MSTRATWTTKEGTEIYIDMMEDRHLVNTLRMIKRHCLAMAKASVRGPRDWKAYRNKSWPHLIAEAEKRNIDYETWGIAPPPCEDTGRAERNLA